MRDSDRRALHAERDVCHGTADTDLVTDLEPTSISGQGIELAFRPECRAFNTFVRQLTLDADKPALWRLFRAGNRDKGANRLLPRRPIVVSRRWRGKDRKQESKKGGRPAYVVSLL